ncbi:MAG: hypothetical protein BGO31_00275 [Bacteroidetes bacterium 43-16]|uniref:hypothetical protein n=1 Tax=Bacteroidota TaxID=976 RepID=UPI00092C020F|nr:MULTISPECIES: hypothetical protein [Bacteroidota]OJV51675.1 MAG: hypothetical protein BGO31_00275 [Bacteroidetes bacterium 43-16]
MAINSKTKAFRIERASELEQFARVLQKSGICDPSYIFDAAKQLRDFEFVPKIEKDDPVDYNFWGYDSGEIIFYFENSPRHTYPVNASNLSLTLTVKVIADYNDFQAICDPYKHLEFNIIINGGLFDKSSQETRELVTSYHLDRHIFKEGDNEPEDCHPIYHLQFGGRKLEKSNRDFGNALILDAPRVAHYPMDIILGVDFILSNFFSKTWRSLRRDGEYINLVKDYQQYFWKPYAHSSASHWKPYTHHDVNWDPVNIWPQLLLLSNG